MKQLFLLFIILSCLFPSGTMAQSFTSVSINDALTIAQRQFVGKDVDYYVLNNNNSDFWNIFVDAEPMKGWEH